MWDILDTDDLFSMPPWPERRTEAGSGREPAPEFSVVIPSRDEGSLLRRTVKSVLATEGPSFEVIVVDDRSRRAPELGKAADAVTLVRGAGQGPSRARNDGAALARGDVLVFLDAHVLVPRDWLTVLGQVLRSDPSLAAVSPGIADEGKRRRTGYGLTWDHRLNVRWLPRPRQEVAEVPLLPSGCLAVRRKVFTESGGFNHAFRGYGHEDEELSLRLWLLGHRLACLGGLRIVHRFRPRFPYLVKLGDMYYNLLRMAVSHFKERRLARVLFLVRRRIDPTLLLARLLSDDAVADRLRWQRQRQHDDDWYMKRFDIPF